MTENKTYRIEELSTTGWELIDDQYQGMDKETTKQKLQWLIDHDERNPSRLRAVPERN